MRGVDERSEAGGCSYIATDPQQASIRYRDPLYTPPTPAVRRGTKFIVIAPRSKVKVRFATLINEGGKGRPQNDDLWVYRHTEGVLQNDATLPFDIV